MSHMGFGDRMSKLIYTLGKGSVSHVMFNGGVHNRFLFEDQLDKDALSVLYYSLL